LAQAILAQATVQGVGPSCMSVFDSYIMAATLLMELHGDLLRALASHHGMHFQGLQQAARHARRFDLIGNGLAKKLIQLDVAFNMLRHVTLPLADQLRKEIAAAIEVAAPKADVAHAGVLPASNAHNQVVISTEQFAALPGVVEQVKIQQQQVLDKIQAQEQDMASMLDRLQALSDPQIPEACDHLALPHGVSFSPVVDVQETPCTSPVQSADHSPTGDDGSGTVFSHLPVASADFVDGCYVQFRQGLPVAGPGEYAYIMDIAARESLLRMQVAFFSTSLHHSKLSERLLQDHLAAFGCRLTSGELLAIDELCLINSKG